MNSKGSCRRSSSPTFILASGCPIYYKLISWFIVYIQHPWCLGLDSIPPKRLPEKKNTYRALAVTLNLSNEVAAPKVGNLVGGLSKLGKHGLADSCSKLSGGFSRQGFGDTESLTKTYHKFNKDQERQSIICTQFSLTFQRFIRRPWGTQFISTTTAGRPSLFRNHFETWWISFYPRKSPSSWFKFMRRRRIRYYHHQSNETAMWLTRWCLYPSQSWYIISCLIDSPRSWSRDPWGDQNPRRSQRIMIVWYKNLKLNRMTRINVWYNWRRVGRYSPRVCHKPKK